MSALVNQSRRAAESNDFYGSRRTLGFASPILRRGSHRARSAICPYKQAHGHIVFLSFAGAAKKRGQRGEKHDVPGRPHPIFVMPCRVGDKPSLRSLSLPFPDGGIGRSKISSRFSSLIHVHIS